MPDTAHLAGAVQRLARSTDDRHLRAQLHALAALVEQIGACGEQDPAENALLEREILDALEREDEERAIASARALAALQRKRVVAVDWTSVSGG